MKPLHEILVEKFGEPAFESLVRDGTITYDESRIPALENECIVQMKNYTSSGILTDEAFEKPPTKWGFDFPGWLGKLGRRDIMIIGLEPNIHTGRWYQVVYDFYDKHDLEPSECAKKLYKLGKEKLEDSRDYIGIWYRIATLFGYKTAYPWNILLHCYITDLCHFAPQDCGSETTIQEAIGNRQRWRDIRKEVADLFLLKEIEAVDPKIIVCQGADAYREVSKKLKLTGSVKEMTFGYPAKHPYSAKINKHEFPSMESGPKEIYVLGIPHLGSRFNIIRKFWNTRIEDVGKFIRTSVPEISIQ